MELCGKIFVIVAPSGTGKSTLIERLKIEIPDLQWSVSCTTRPKRVGEVEGEDYFYLTEEDFVSRIERNEFVEWAKVHSKYYGTLKSFVDEGLKAGKTMLFDLDVQGSDSFREVYGERAQIIFISPPSYEELERRLRARATDSLEVIEERLQNAKSELKRAKDYDFEVVNDDLERAYLDLKNIITGKVQA